MIRAVLFDLGKVLVAFDHGFTLRHLEKVTGVAADALRPVVFGDLEKDFDRGALSAEEFFRSVEREAGLPRLEDATWVEAWRDIFTPLPEAEAAVEALRPDLRTAIVSNTNVLHWEGVERVTSVTTRVDALALSFRVNVLKPDPAIYRIALDALDVAPEEAVYADDKPEFVVAARELGLDAFTVNGPASLAEGLEVRGLLTTIAQDRFAKGVALFVDGKFFEAHEEWEAIWMKSEGDDKRLLQGLIQLAAGGVHVTRGNDAPARRLFGLALEKLEASPSTARGLDVRGLRASLREVVEGASVDVSRLSGLLAVR